MYTFRQPIKIEGWINHIQVSTVTDHTSNTIIDRYLFRKTLCNLSTLKSDGGDEVIILQTDIGDYAINFSVCDANVFADITEVYNFLFDMLNARDKVSAQPDGAYTVAGTVTAKEATPVYNPIVATLACPGSKTYSPGDEISNQDAPVTPTMLQFTDCVPTAGGSGVLKRISIVAPEFMAGDLELHLHNYTNAIPEHDGQEFLYGNTSSPPEMTFNINLQSSPSSVQAFGEMDVDFKFTCVAKDLHMRFKTLFGFVAPSNYQVIVTLHFL